MCSSTLILSVLLLHVGRRCLSLAAFVRFEGAGPAQWGQHHAMWLKPLQTLHPYWPWLSC